MTDERFYQLGLSGSERVCRSERAEERAQEMSCRVLVALPAPCEGTRQDEIVGELAQLLTASGCRTAVLSSDVSNASFKKSATGVMRGDAILRQARYFRALTRRLITVDVLHLVYYSGVSFAREIVPSVLLAKFFGKKVVLDYRRAIIFGPRPGERFLTERIWRLCDRVMVLSPFQRQLVSSFGGRAEYIKPGVAIEKVAARVIKEIQPRIVVSADLEKEYDVATAVRAFRLVKQKYPRTEMTVIGIGSEEARLKEMAARENLTGITFAGELDSQRRLKLLQQSELYLNCASVDHFPVAVVEAFACGLVVLTTPMSGGSGDIFRSRENIILLPYNDHVGTAERIIELVENPELTEKLSRRSREMALSYTTGTRRKEWTRFYRSLSRNCD